LWSWFFCHGTAPAELYPLSLHDALPICERHVPLETEVAHLVLQCLTQLAFPEDEQPRIGQFACDQGHGIDEVALALVRNESRHVADQRGAVRQPERGVCIDGGLPVDQADVDAIVDDLDTRGFDAILLEDPRNRV